MESGLNYSDKYDSAMENDAVAARHESLLKATEEDLCKVSTTTKDNRVAYEFKEFRTLDKDHTLSESFYTLISKYLPYAKSSEYFSGSSLCKNFPWASLKCFLCYPLTQTTLSSK